jgi:hypothetical protein
VGKPCSVFNSLQELIIVLPQPEASRLRSNDDMVSIYSFHVRNEPVQDLVNVGANLFRRATPVSRSIDGRVHWRMMGHLVPELACAVRTETAFQSILLDVDACPHSVLQKLGRTERVEWLRMLVSIRYSWGRHSEADRKQYPPTMGVSDLLQAGSKAYSSGKSG